MISIFHERDPKNTIHFSFNKCPVTELGASVPYWSIVI